jgi:hypothetical protein
MELARNSYPVRGFIRHKAKMQILTRQAMEDDVCPTVDDDLIRELTQTLLTSERGDAAYRSYPDRETANAVENQFAAEIAESYQRIKQQTTSDTVQRLNQLFDR